MAARRGLKVCILEHKSEAGKKILRTGNGKCNITHAGIKADDYPQSCREIVGKVFDSFGYDETVTFFKETGIFPVEKKGCIYPMSGTALSVRNALVDELKSLKAELITGAEVKSIKSEETSFTIKADCDDREEIIKAASLVIATGSCAAPVTGSDGSGYKLLKGLGVKTVKPLPALVKLLSDDRTCKRAAGVRVEGIVRLFIEGELTAEERGELQFTDDGISGIPVFQISREAAPAIYEGKSVETESDLAPDMSAEDLKEYFIYGFEKASDRSIKNFLGGIIPSRMVTAVADKAGVSADRKLSEISKDKCEALINAIKNYRLRITGTGGFDDAQVCRGGVDLSEIDYDTLEHKNFKGLFFCGEIIDVDGPCGGYNLQWAWSSGAVAGMNV